MITDDQVSKALTYLAETDEKAAMMKADVERKEFLYKRAKDLTFKLAEGTVADRNAIAGTSDKVAEAAEAWFVAIEHCEGVKAKRQRAALVIEVWRSCQANRRAGGM